MDTRGGPIEIVIEPKSGWRAIDLAELIEYRDLLYFLVWRDIKVRYKQTVMGFAWALIQPVFSMIIFTVIFGKVAKISSDGVPYAIFSYAALVPWTYFSNALSQSSTSLVSQANLISKIYFPRLMVPLAAVFSQLVDFGIALLLLFGMMLFFGIAPTPWALLVPFLVLLMMLTAAGMGACLTALAIQYRDIKHGIGLGLTFLMYASPVVYPVSLIPEQYRIIYGLNPMAGVIEGFRAALLGSSPMPWDLLAVGGSIAVLIAVCGAHYFRRMEGTFADVA